MSGTVSTRRGSALLVVIGMLSFMVISGIAFSAFMRSTRLPASFSRRAVTTRQLAKAALAEAIDQIDRAIANDPHPNVRVNNANENNYWVGRVLVTTDETGTAQKKPAEVAEDIVKNPNGGCADTVPVLTLEALAYLPPPLVNEARYYGQKTPTAAWQTFDFDSGRYAYIALDVSDYFDVNRLMAEDARSSNPSRRVAFGYAFENDEHTSRPSGTAAWGTFMDSFRTVGDDGTFSFGSKTPLVSLADFNLAFGSQTIGGMKSPFVNYVQSGGAGDGFYGAAPGSEVFEKAAMMTFVTDSLEAPLLADETKTDAGEKILDLDDESNQIFTESFLDSPQEDRPLLAIGGMKTQPFSRLVQRRVPYVTMFALNDYLDCDRVPITLGMPSVERVPMICGIKPAVNGAQAKVSVVRNPENGGNDKESGSKEKIHVVRNVRWRLDAAALAGGFMGGQVQTLVVYPFRNHERAAESGYFKIDGKVQLFLSSADMRLRTGNSEDLLHWSASGSAANGGNAQLMNGAVMNLPLSAEGIPLKSSISTPADCVYQIDFPLAQSASAIATELADEKGDILDVTYEWDKILVDEKTMKYEPEYGLDVLPPANCITKVSSALRPLRADGTVDPDFVNLTPSSVASLDKTLQLNMTVTLRVISSDGAVLGEGSSGTKTVDMVPATLLDDDPLNGINNSLGIAAGIYNAITGDPTPLMKFETGVSFPCKLDLTAVCATPVAVTPSAVMVDDPRYNHAPENWKELTSFSPAGWFAAQTSAANDGDIFMATADQDYMQSVYEFAFLPRCSNLERYNNVFRGDLPGYPSADSSWTKLCAQNPIDANFMWKTYDIFGRYSDAGDDFEGLGLENLGRGLRVNPYSDSTNVIMAAFANTPHDWRAASENEEENTGADLAAEEFNAKFAWNQYSSGEKLAWEDLEAVAGEFMRRVRSGATNGTGNWKDALIELFDQARAQDTEQYLCGVQLESPSDPVYSVDKKFLYGYWRNCFAARQQLFLVFFRAEPMMLGGGIAGVTPPQLGAKGVALVWRNPNKTSGSANNNVNTSGYVPHQTRVLFYRQFE